MKGKYPKEKQAVTTELELGGDARFVYSTTPNIETPPTPTYEHTVPYPQSRIPFKAPTPTHTPYQFHSHK